MNTREGTEKTSQGHYDLFVVFVKSIPPPPQEKHKKLKEEARWVPP
jgi:hypothetical protein